MALLVVALEPLLYKIIIFNNFQTDYLEKITPQTGSFKINSIKMYIKMPYNDILLTFIEVLWSKYV